MKNIAAIITFLTALSLTPQFALAAPGAIVVMTHPAITKASNPSACHAIASADARTMCRAKAHKDPAICYGIQDQALRATCRSEVGR